MCIRDRYSYANWSENGVELQTQKNIEENYEKDSKQAVLRFRLKKLNVKVGEILERLRDNELPSDKKQILLKTYHKVLDHRKSLAEDLGAIVL